MEKKISVLIVDDDVNLGDTLLDILEAKGYDAEFVSSGKKALNKVEEKKYDIVLMDIKMPGMNGVETLKQVNLLSPLTTVVMVTAFAQDELVSQAREEGALQVLSKPLDIDQIAEFLKKQELLKTMFIVDDDPAFCNSLKDSIELHSYSITVVNTAQEAIDTFEKQKYGIILLDMKLNGKNGLDVAEAIKKQGYKCPIVMMSAHHKEFQSLIDNSGLECKFVEKPFEIDSILEILNEVSRKELKKALA